MTHAQLVTIAARWLRHTQHCGVVLTEVVSALNEIPDAIGFKSGWCSILVECKVSLADLRRDRDKCCERADGRMGSQRFYLVPPVLVAQLESRQYADVPPTWGLLTLTSRGTVRVIRKAAEISVITDSGRRAELALLVSVLRRYQAQGITYTPIDRRTTSQRAAAYRQFETDVREARQLMGLEARP